MIEQILFSSWLMVPLGLISVLALTTCLNRLWALAEANVVPNEIVSLDAAGISQLPTVLKSSDSSLARVLQSVVDASQTTIDDALTQLGEAIDWEVRRLQRFLTFIGSIAAIAPLTGLLGTVFGLIDVFLALNFTGARDPSVFASGIAEALGTTAVGLTIAIPTLLCHRHLTKRVDNLTVQLEKVSSRLVKAWMSRSQA